MKSTKLYSVDRTKLVGKNIGMLNPTCKSMIRTLFELSKEESFNGISSTELMKECVKRGWKTEQSEDKFHTTFNFYSKKLRTDWNMIVVGEVAEQSEIEILE